MSSAKGQPQGKNGISSPRPWTTTSQKQRRWRRGLCVPRTILMRLMRGDNGKKDYSLMDYSLWLWCDTVSAGRHGEQQIILLWGLFVHVTEFSLNLIDKVWNGDESTDDWRHSLTSWIHICPGFICLRLIYDYLLLLSATDSNDDAPSSTIEANKRTSHKYNQERSFVQTPVAN